MQTAIKYFTIERFKAMNSKKISVIILTFNGLNFLKSCLPTIRKQTYKNFEIIIVDNHSTDDTLEFVSKNFPGARIVRNKANYGFPKGNNIGAKKAKGDYLFFLNNDTELFPDTLEQLIKAYRPKSLLSPYQIPARNKKLQGRAGAGMDIFGFPFVDQDDLDKTKFFYADGAGLFIERADFFAIGMFDEELFFFQEDIDLSWRARIFGYNVIPCPKIKFYHYYGGTAKLNLDSRRRLRTSYFRRYYNDRNAIRNIIKNYSFPIVIPILSMLIFFYFLEMALFLFLRDLRAVKCYLNAFRWNLVHIKDTLRARRTVQKGRRVSDWNLMRDMYWQYSKLILFLKFELPWFQD
ncbi:hypothetical protein A2866_05560 [Candidatus Roizmanbacteria bacterium RIFCSPHIGHO2_01_FULL_39_8]|uniref:Glycosyltransferase 2-like domain-containing protein n=2 Tax=Candidatus Roizmaniibacteriota TaxID=1752723 RepID=A0A1F7GFV6_9BACT|nr:MAG: hypothetical protein A2866_05560 [Candidatus Roizmanbacteria bacterium RIFCSPHIGHO2_01_FULL_39_8]OGK37812.1 MAG: hypothetical protein A3F60_00090 [Candidatus Roizmanbacteria bacterium RIFCSPHIGHO2_12_FULL_39_8]